MNGLGSLKTRWVFKVHQLLSLSPHSTHLGLWHNNLWLRCLSVSVSGSFSFRH